MANTTPIVTTITKTATKEKIPNATETASRNNILDFCEKHYEDSLPVMDKIRRDKRREVHTMLDFGEDSRKSQRMRENPQNSIAKTLSARYRNPSERPQIWDRLRNNNGNVFGRLGQTGNTLEMIPTVEVVLTNGTLLLAEIVLEAETTPTASNNRDPEDHVKIFQAATQVERWAMPTWCHMFNSTLIGTARVWFNELPPESIDGYKDLKAAFLAYFMQQKKYVKDPVEIYNIKKKDGETIEDFMKRFMIETARMKGAPECMRIFGFMHGVNNTELTKRLNEHVPKTLEEMMIAIAAFIRGETAAASKMKAHTLWKSQDYKFTPLTRTPKEIFTAESGKFKPPPPMVTSVEKRSSNKFCEFHNDKGHNTAECVQLRKQIEELVRAGKLSHFIKEIRRDRDQQKTRKKDAPVKDKAATIYMIQPRSSMEVLYEHCFNRLRLEIKSQMVPATTSLTGFSGETIWPHGRLRLLVTIGDAEHYTRAWMNFMILRSPSPHNGIIRRPGIREIQAVSSTAHGMLKFPVNGGIVTICSTILTPTECTTIAATPKDHAKKTEARHENFKVAIHPDFPDQENTIRGTVSIKARTELYTLLKRNLDIFAWQLSDMTGVPRSIFEHRLNMREGYSPVRQKKQGQALKHAKAIQVEVQKLVEAGILREVYYHDWLSNAVMVKKHDDSWRMSNPFAATPLSVSWTHTKATIKYRWPNKMRKRQLFTPVTGQVDRNLEIYVDDLVIKSHTETELLRDIEETFHALRKINMKLNPKKYAEQAFKQLKQHLARLPMLVAPKPKKELIMYLSASYGAISAVLMTERDTVQIPIYFVSRALQAPELNYTPMEKLVLTLVCAAKSITYRPRTSVKGQILANFLVEKPDDAQPDTSVIKTPQESWTLFTDGSSCVDGAGAGLILTSPEGTEFTYALRFQFTASNNEAEYEALIAGLRIAAQIGVHNIVLTCLQN
nr:hypothetical protein [Tanacetum cinerariifolium]